MLDIQKQINNVIAAMLTIAWASTKKRDVSQDEISAVYKNFAEINNWIKYKIIIVFWNWKMI